jgi:hypothetical protein
MTIGLEIENRPTAARDFHIWMNAGEKLIKAGHLRYCVIYNKKAIKILRILLS